MIYLPGLQVNVLDLLLEQHKKYTTELAQVHQNLSKLYNKLATIERDLSQSLELGLSRKAKRRRHWSRSEAKDAVKKLEYSEASLHEYLHQCNNLISSYSIDPASLWDCPPISYPPGPYCPSLLAAVSIPFTPVHHATSFFQGSCSARGPQIWDLSTLPERDPSPGQGRPIAIESYEPPLHGGPFDGIAVQNDDSQHVFVHEIVRQQENLATACNDIQLPSVSEAQGQVPELPSTWAIHWTELAAAGGAVTEKEGTGTNSSQSPPQSKRRFSENAIQQTLEARLSAALTSTSAPVSPLTSAFMEKVGHKRGVSLGSAT